MRRREAPAARENSNRRGRPDPHAGELEEERDAGENSHDGDDAKRRVVGAEDREHRLVDELAADLEVAVVGDEEVLERERVEVAWDVLAEIRLAAEVTELVA